MANMSVARCISEHFPVGAMLRRHPAPRDIVLEELVRKCGCTVEPLDMDNQCQDALDILTTGQPKADYYDNLQCITGAEVCFHRV